MNPRQSTANELGDFLRARRAEITPADVGLPETRHPRRVTGLRREEVAQLASISTDYYTRIEQGRLSSASAESLDAIARALRLSPDQSTYLHQLAGKSGSVRRRSSSPQRVHPQTHALLDNLTTAPALVLDRQMNVLAWNVLASALYTDFSALPSAERNLLRLTFLDPRIRDLYVDWEDTARQCVAFIRMDTAQAPTDPDLQALVGELAVRDEDFSRWWVSHSVAHKTFGTKRFRHPLAGEISLEWQILICPHDPQQSIMIMTAPPGSPARQALDFLASWVTEQSHRSPSGQ
ncbi:helix-turn-helix transcriptional regulator [Rhodococcus opacus]|uniref:helix-turn-helix transcriptional regulator n=1 Tax=Rhodococcus opacus TaxID=37919 RepID=UPI001C46680C|nr:helix-turn-helix transcriptional regulator [Rhodococcus opacus]MBV6761937.1 helix-turn-helix transcriptional regulator [Rhodococcus opacus]